MAWQSGFQIIEDLSMTDTVEDWSDVRSPSRARRRRKKHRQRIIIRLVPKPSAYRVGNTLIMHPELARQMRDMIKEQGE